MSQVEQLRAALECTLNPDDSQRKPAEELLRSNEKVNGPNDLLDTIRGRGGEGIQYLFSVCLDPGQCDSSLTLFLYVRE